MSAVFSPDRKYRYRLERGAGPIVVAWFMVNPSDADEETNDPTIRKVLGFTARWFGPARVIVGNKYALCSTKIGGLRPPAEPIGPDNDAHIEAIMDEADVVVFGWGSLTKLPPYLRRRWWAVNEIALACGHLPLCFGLNDDGHPKHPCMTGYDVAPAIWSPPHG